MTDNIPEFVARYAPAVDEWRIRFAWNGEHADNFVDRNEAFRGRVIEVVLANLSTAPIELVRDLFHAETLWAKEAWCIRYAWVHPLACELVHRGGLRYVEDYLAGKHRGMDSSCSATVPHTPELGQAFLAEVERRLASDPDADRRRLLEAGRRIFQFGIDRPRA